MNKFSFFLLNISLPPPTNPISMVWCGKHRQQFLSIISQLSSFGVENATRN